MKSYIRFNTGRGYTPDGQDIEAAVVETKEELFFEDEPKLGTMRLSQVVMVDNSRRLTYTFGITGELSEEKVMERYDRNDGTEHPTIEQMEKFETVKTEQRE